MSKIRADVVELLRAGVTHREIKARLGVSSNTLTATRKALGIPVPERRTVPQEKRRAATERRHPDVVAMLRAGATHREIMDATGVSAPTITRVRRVVGIPVPDRRIQTERTPARTIPDVLAHYSRPAGDGHVHWAGPFNGNRPVLWHHQRPLQARREVFRAHHGRDPEGRVLACADDPECIAGPHLTDDRIRQANARADDAFEQIFGTPTSEQSH